MALGGYPKVGKILLISWRYGASLGVALCFINNPILRLKIEEFSLSARSEHLKSQPNYPKHMVGSKNNSFFYSTYVGTFCDPSIEFIT